MIVVSRQMNPMSASAATPAKGLELVRKDEIAAPSIQSTQLELAAGINANKSPASTKLVRTGEAVG
jgi:hypothetical protein